MKKVVLVDDQPQVLASIERALAGIGAVVRSFSDPEQALQACLAEPPDVLVSDYRMPGMDGVELLGRIHAAHPHVTCILHTGSPELPGFPPALRLVSKGKAGGLRAAVVESLGGGAS